MSGSTRSIPGQETAGPEIGTDAAGSNVSAALQGCPPVASSDSDGAASQSVVKTRRYVRRDAPSLSAVEIARFWAKVEKSAGCWLWTAAISSGGYGVFQIRVRRAPRMLIAHRIALFLASGQWCPDLLACHRCDEPRCVRPDHLYYGTDRDNASDAADRGGVWHKVKARRCLINAAPDLLACLKEAVASCEDGDQTADDAEPEDGDPLAEWKAAIAKAEGR